MKMNNILHICPRTFVCPDGKKKFFVPLCLYNYKILVPNAPVYKHQFPIDVSLLHNIYPYAS